MTNDPHSLKFRALHGDALALEILLGQTEIAATERITSALRADLVQTNARGWKARHPEIDRYLSQETR